MIDLGLPPIIGHRGARGLAPENTISGLRACFDQGVFAVEVDAKLTQDGVVVLMHDDALDRTTDGGGPVAETPFSLVHSLNAAAAFPDRPAEPPPTLVEALELVQSVGGSINIEIKPCAGRERETTAAVIDVVRSTWRRGPLPLLSSFQRPALEACRDLAPDLPRGYLSSTEGEDWAAAAKALGCTTLNLAWQLLTPAAVPALLANGLPLLLWTVNDPALARAFLAVGATAIITDRPDIVRA